MEEKFVLRIFVQLTKEGDKIVATTTLKSDGVQTYKRPALHEPNYLFTLATLPIEGVQRSEPMNLVLAWLKAAEMQCYAQNMTVEVTGKNDTGIA